MLPLTLEESGSAMRSNKRGCQSSRAGADQARAGHFRRPPRLHDLTIPPRCPLVLTTGAVCGRTVLQLLRSGSGTLARSGRRENRVRLRYYIPRAGQTAGVPVDDPKAADLAHVATLTTMVSAACGGLRSADDDASVSHGTLSPFAAPQRSRPVTGSLLP